MPLPKPSFSILHGSLPVRVCLTLSFAAAAAWLCVLLRTPLPWMVGPLLATSLLSMLGAPTASWTPLRNGGQWTIGCALGLYFTPQMVALVAGLWWAILLGTVWALALGLVVGAWLYRLHRGPGPLQIVGLSRVTTYFASPIGAASEMTLLGEAHGAQTDLVASAHSLRVLLVTLIIPFGFQWAGLHGLDATFPGARVVQWPGLALLALLTGIGCWVMIKLKFNNAWFIGAFFAALLLTTNGITLSAVPQLMTNAAQLVISVSLGVRFTPAFVHKAPRWLSSVALSTVAMIALCAAFAVALAQLINVHWATLLLGTAPGGLAEMAITAKVLQLSVPVVTAFHVTRFAAVLVLVGPIYRWFYLGRLKAGDKSPSVN